MKLTKGLTSYLFYCMGLLKTSLIQYHGNFFRMSVTQMYNHGYS